MYSVNQANHVTTEKVSSYSPFKSPYKQKSNSFRRFSKVMISAGVVSSLIIATLPSVTTTYAATDGQASTGSVPERIVLSSSSPSPSNPSETSSATQKLHYTEVEGGYYYTVALRSDDSVWTWGRNLLGELGISETIRYRHTSGPVRISQLSSVTAISTSGEGYSVAVQTDGTAWQWGAGRTPSQVPGITNAVQVTAGLATTLVILGDGTVQSWPNPEQKLPDRSSPEAEPKPVLHQITGLNDVVQTALIGLDGYALQKNGTVWTWKEASYTNKTPSKPKQIKDLSNISSITNQSGDLLVLDSKGRVWRLNSQGQRTAYHHELNVKKMDASWNYVLLLTTAGEVYSYGRTVTGKQGKVNSLSNIIDVSAGYYHSLARSSDGTIWGWGGDKYEEAGAPATSAGGMIYKPVQAKLGTDIYVKGQLLQSPYSAVDTSKTIQLPMKDIASALGAQFQVHTVEGLISHYTLKYNDRIITIKPNERRYTVSSLTKLHPQEEQVVTLSEPIGNYSGATAVPYELLRGLGLNVTWDSNAARVTIDEVN